MGDSDNAAASEARWRNYQHLIWTQQQIQLQLQHQQQHHHQQQMQNPKMNGMEMENGLQPLPLPEKSLEDKPKEGMDPWENFDAQAAFLGPSLWDKRLPYDGQDFKLEYVDLEEFLTENGIPVEGHHGEHHYLKNGHGPSHNNGNGPSNGPAQNGNSAGPGMPPEHLNNSDISPPGVEVGVEHPPHGGMIGPYGPGPSRNPQQGLINNNSPNQQNLLRGPSSIPQSEMSRSPSPCGSSISSNSDDSSAGSVQHNHQFDDSHEHEMTKVSKHVKFSIEDMAMASFPGPNFDPRTRIFTEDELKPQPMIKKSKKQFVPDNAKDAKYWARRRKNNMAAKRSRDARRVKENQIAMRACFLEKENSILKSEIDRIQKENMLLKEQLNCCRREH